MPDDRDTMPNPERVRETLHRMADAVADMLKPDGMGYAVAGLPLIRMTIAPPGRAPYVLVVGVQHPPEEGDSDA